MELLCDHYRLYFARTKSRDNDKFEWLWLHATIDPLVPSAPWSILNLCYSPRFATFISHLLPLLTEPAQSIITS